MHIKLRSHIEHNAYLLHRINTLAGKPRDESRGRLLVLGVQRVLLRRDVLREEGGPLEEKREEDRADGAPMRR